MSERLRERAHVAADLVVLTLREGSLHVVLIKRAKSTEYGKWSLPGGFMHAGESAEDTAYRKLAEDVGISSEECVLEQLYTYTAPSRDPRPQRAISVSWVALGANMPERLAVTDALEATWVPVEQALTMRLAFDHADILAAGIERSRGKLEYTNLATAFLPASFTMSQLRGVYEAVWGGALEPANFHRKVLSVPNFVEETGETRSGRGRPAKLYRAGSARTIHPPLTRASIRD